jgi:6-methylsalicylate decarboxylase
MTTVDLHHHVIPDFYWDASNEGGNAAGGINPPRWSLDGAIGYLDEAGIDVAVSSRAIAKLHRSNTFARTPDVKYVFVHAGGTIPFVASRFEIVDEMNVIPGQPERGAFADTIARRYRDTATAFIDPVLRMLRSVTGLANVVFGTDYPYPLDDISIGGLRQVENIRELDDTEREALLAGWAARLTPRLAKLSHQRV